MSLTENLTGDHLDVKLNRADAEGLCDHIAEVVAELREKSPAAWAEAFALTQQVWTAYLATKAQGREIPEALAAQKAAAESPTLEEYLGKMQEAARRYQQGG